MFNYLKVDFPDTIIKPSYVYHFTLNQNRYMHEVASLTFRDWALNYDSISTGSLINFTLFDGVNKKEFKGYVHAVVPDQSPSHNVTEVIAVGASYSMKNPSQKVYENLSADAVVEQIAKKYRFNSFTTPHPRIYPQISQAGHTDWELMVRLAKQSGYSLRTENTEIYFQPMLEEYTTKRESAPRFIMRDASNPSGSTIYSFKPEISENMKRDEDVKAAIAVAGVDSASKTSMSITKQKRDTRTRSSSKAEFFDRFDTHVVATDPAVAQYEAEAADQRALFPYRATAVVLGNASLRPDLPVYLEGVGDYSGYWIILGAEHNVEEQGRNIFTYTTRLYLGTDSLGTATRWKDGKEVISPTSSAERVLIPGVRQTNTAPTSRVIKTAPNVGPQSVGNFSRASNRPKELTNNRIVNSPVWVASAPTPSKITQPTVSTPAIPNRILSKVVRDV